MEPMDQPDMGNDDGMGSMNMGPGIPGLFYMARMYWAFVGAVIAFAAVINLLNKVLAWQRSVSKLAPGMSCEIANSAAENAL